MAAGLSERSSYASIGDMKNEHDREPTPDETTGIVWWNSLREADRADWLARVGSAVPADAWAAYKRLGDVDPQAADYKLTTILKRSGVPKSAVRVRAFGD